MHAEGWLEGAAAELRRVVRRQPDDAGAQALLGQMLLELGDAPGADAAFASARALVPGLANEFSAHSDEARKAGQRRQALGCLLVASRLAPNSAGTKSRIADLYYYQIGDLEKAAAWMDAACRTSGRAALRLKRLILGFYPVYRSVAHLQEIRARYLERLTELEQAPLRIENILTEVNLTNFYLAYQGMNERDTQARLARILLRAAPELGFIAEHCTRAPARRTRLRVGIISMYFGRRHSIGIAYNRLIQLLAERSDLELQVICFSDEGAAAVQAELGDRGTAVAVSGRDLAQARRQLAARELDVLLYADIGMEPVTYYLAYGRYAPLQGVLGGHPLTTGIPNQDVYISSDLQEAPEAQEHYTERLVRLQHLAMGMEPPVLPPRRSREELGLPASGNLYVCPLRVHRFHPEFDATLAALVDADADAEIVLFEDSQHPAWDRQVRERLAAVLGRRVERVTLLPWQSSENFLAILASCNVALDTFHFGAGTTGPLAFGVGCPMVTLPSRFQRGRSVQAYYRAMRIEGCIAGDAEEYVRIAVRIARDPAYRAVLAEQLIARSPVLFDTRPAAQELADTLHALYRERT